MNKKRTFNKRVTEYRIFNGKGASEGQKVEVHYNLHEGGFTIADYKTKRVIAYAPTVNLLNVTTRVREGGRQRVIAKGAKNVHAHIIGYFTFSDLNMEGASKMTYNPYINTTFVDTETGNSVLSASKVLCIGKGAIYI